MLKQNRLLQMLNPGQQEETEFGFSDMIASSSDEFWFMETNVLRFQLIHFFFFIKVQNLISA